VEAITGNYDAFREKIIADRPCRNAGLLPEAVSTPSMPFLGVVNNKLYIFHPDVLSSWAWIPMPNLNGILPTCAASGRTRAPFVAAGKAVELVMAVFRESAVLRLSRHADQGVDELQTCTDPGDSP